MTLDEAKSNVSSVYDIHKNDRACSHKERELIDKERDAVIALLDELKTLREKVNPHTSD